MKSRIFITLIALILCCGSSRTFAENDNSVLWGIKASADIELPGKWKGDAGSVKMFSPGYGFTIGGVSNIYFGRNFYFEPGLSLFYSHYKYDDLDVTNTDATVATHNPKIYKLGIRIPMVFGYTFGFSEQFTMNVFTGPQLQYAFAGKIDFDKDAFEGTEDDFDLWGINGQRRFDCSWKIGVGFPVSSFNVSLEADLGISDLLKGGMKFRENRVGLGLTYFF